jgi:recombinational DNA repair protein (RecF pathway)
METVYLVVGFALSGLMGLGVLTFLSIGLYRCQKQLMELFTTSQAELMDVYQASERSQERVHKMQASLDYYQTQEFLWSENKSDSALERAKLLTELQRMSEYVDELKAENEQLRQKRAGTGE